MTLSISSSPTSLLTITWVGTVIAARRGARSIEPVVHWAGEGAGDAAVVVAGDFVVAGTVAGGVETSAFDDLA
jgi:hypothetical protein